MNNTRLGVSALFLSTLMLLSTQHAIATDAAATKATKAALSQLAGTLSVNAQPYFSEGKLVGCTLVFAAIEQDRVYSQGEFLRIDGNVGVMILSGKIGTNLKVVVNKFALASEGLEFIPSPPSRAYLISEKLSTNVASLVGTPESDTPGALFSVFQPTPTLDMIAEGLNTRRLTVAFNQRHGKSDVRLKLELDVANTDATGQRIRSTKAIDDFTACLSSLNTD